MNGQGHRLISCLEMPAGCINGTHIDTPWKIADVNGQLTRPAKFMHPLRKTANLRGTNRYGKQHLRQFRGGGDVVNTTKHLLNTAIIPVKHPFIVGKQREPAWADSASTNLGLPNRIHTQNIESKK